MKRVLTSFTLLSLVSLAACETETPTSAVVDNQLPAPIEVRRVWWEPTYFADLVPSGSTSAELRTVPETGLAYALVAEPGSDALVILRSREPLTVARGEALRIVVSDATFAGRCAAGSPLAQADADFVAERIFPVELDGRTYDAATCTLTGGADAAPSR